MLQAECMWALPDPMADLIDIDILPSSSAPIDLPRSQLAFRPPLGRKDAPHQDGHDRLATHEVLLAMRLERESLERHVDAWMWSLMEHLRQRLPSELAESLNGLLHHGAWQGALDKHAKPKKKKNGGPDPRPCPAVTRLGGDDPLPSELTKESSYSAGDTLPACNSESPTSVGNSEGPAGCLEDAPRIIGQSQELFIVKEHYEDAPAKPAKKSGSVNFEDLVNGCENGNGNVLNGDHQIESKEGLNGVSAKPKHIKMHGCRFSGADFEGDPNLAHRDKEMKALEEQLKDCSKRRTTMYANVRKEENTQSKQSMMVTVQEGVRRSTVAAKELKRVGTNITDSLVRTTTSDQNDEAIEEALEMDAKRKESKKSMDQRCSARIVTSPAYNLLCSIMIVLNSILIGVVTQHGTTTTHSVIWHDVLSLVFSGYFFIELVLRVHHVGCRRYFTEGEVYWNIFDFTLVLVSVVDISMSVLGADVSIASAAKTIKMLRICRIFRVFRFFRQLSLLALMIADSIKSLVWALVMLSIIVYVFAICFTQNATEHLQTSDVKAYDVRTQFGSLEKTIYFLILSMLGGISWHEVSDTVMVIGAGTSFLFFFYIAFTMLAVLNIITGVFVDNAVETAKLERDFLIEKEMDLRAQYVQELIRMFNELDDDGSGSINWEEFAHFFEEPRVRGYFAAIGLEANDLQKLWQLIDDDDSGCIDVHEFLDGCQRLRGEARAIDIHAILRECRRIEAHCAALEKQQRSSCRSE